MNDTDQISSTFLDARRDARPLERFPGKVPDSLQAAYAVQSRSIADWGEDIVGFKVGGIAPDWRELYPSSWLAGPVFHSHLVQADEDNETDVAVFDGGFAAYEPEFILRLGNLTAPRREVDDLDTAKTFVRSVHIGAEIASSPLATLNDLGPGSIISDFGNQSAVAVGREIDRSWLDKLDQIEVTTRIDGEIVGRANAKPAAGGPFDALRFLLNHLRDNPYGRMEIDELWLSSGAITGVHSAQIGSHCMIDYHGLGRLRLHMTRKEPLKA